MNNNLSKIKIFVTSLAVSALALFAGRGLLVVYGQSATGTPQQPSSNTASDFRRVVEEGKQQVNNDKDAQNNQHEIDNEEDEKAGDQHGENEAIDGEKPENEIEQEVENEVEQEGDQGSKQSDEENSASSATDGATDSSNNSEGE